MKKTRMFLKLCILVFSCIITCAAVSCKETKKSAESSEITAQISDPSNAEEIAGIINKDIQDGLERAQADMGNGMPQLYIADLNDNYFSYKGAVPFYSGANSFERPITVFLNNNGITYFFDDQLDNVHTIKINAPMDSFAANDKPITSPVLTNDRKTILRLDTITVKIRGTDTPCYKIELSDSTMEWILRNLEIDSNYFGKTAYISQEYYDAVIEYLLFINKIFKENPNSSSKCNKDLVRRVEA